MKKTIAEELNEIEEGVKKLKELEDKDLMDFLDRVGVAVQEEKDKVKVTKKKIIIEWERIVPNGPDDFEREMVDKEFDNIEDAIEFLETLKIEE